MRLLVQLVKEAKVTVRERETGSIGRGLLVFLGIHINDTFSDYFISLLKLQSTMSTGLFGEHMLVSSVNDGPATFLLESPEKPSHTKIL